MIGFELLFGTISDDLKRRSDVLVAVIHLQCIQRGFLCVGTGEEFAESGETGSELLPNGWNQSAEIYVLRYVNPKSGQKLLIKAVNVSHILIISALIMGHDTASSHSFNIDDYITNHFTTLNRAFVSGSADNTSDVLEKQVMSKAMSKGSTEKATNTNTNRNTNERTPETGQDPLRVGPPRYANPYGPLGVGYDPRQGGQWPPPIGGADLDPLGQGQGGMIMDPRNFPAPLGHPRNPAPGLPRGAVPPGARFDPFGPPGVGPNPRPNRNPRNMGPDPDHMPPPGYDDMFM